MQTHFLDGFELWRVQNENEASVGAYLAKLGGLISRTHTF